MVDRTTERESERQPPDAAPPSSGYADDRDQE